MDAIRQAPSPVPVDETPRSAPDVPSLTRGLRDGSEDAYRLFHEAYCTRLTHYLLAVTAGNEHATREALQETYKRIVKYVRIFSDEDVFWSWLTVLARSAHSDLQRKQRRYFALLDRFTLEASPVRDEADLLGDALRRCVTILPLEERQLVEWKYFDHESVAAIASRMGTTEKAVESRLARIRKKLKSDVLSALKDDTPL